MRCAARPARKLASRTTRNWRRSTLAGLAIARPRSELSGTGTVSVVTVCSVPGDVVTVSLVVVPFGASGSVLPSRIVVSVIRCSPPTVVVT